MMNHYSYHSVTSSISVISFESQYKLLFYRSFGHSNAFERAIRIRIILSIFWSENVNSNFLLVFTLETLPVSKIKANYFGFS